MGVIADIIGNLGVAGSDWAKRESDKDFERERSERSASQAKSLADYNAKLDLQKQTMLQELALKNMPKVAAAQREAANVGLNAIGEKAKEYMESGIPVEAAPVTSLSGDGATKGKLMQGDYESLKARAASLPQADQAPYLAQLERQFSGDAEKAQGLVAGKMRPATPAEAQAKAVEWASVNDLGAYADFDSKIGKGKRDEKKIDNAEKKADQRYDSDMVRQDSNDEHRRRMDDRQINLSEGQAMRQQGNMDKAELVSQRSSVTEGMKSIERELERTMTLASNTLDPGMKKMLDGRVEGLTQDLARHRTALESFGGDRIADRAPAPQGASVKYDAKGNAWVRDGNGNPVLKSEFDKRTAEPRAKAPPQDAPSPPTKPADTQSAKQPQAAPDNSTLGIIQQAKMKQLDELVAQVKQAQTYLQATAKSGDPTALQLYAKEVQAARDKLSAKAKELLGNNADKYLSTAI